MKLFAGAGACALALGLAACGSSPSEESAASKQGGQASKPAAAATPNTKLTVLAPAGSATVRADHVVVRGTVVPADAQVQVMGKTAKVSDGLFRTNAALQMGANDIDVVAVVTGAEPVTTTVSVTRGRTAAQLAAAAAAKKKRQARAAAARKAKAERAAARRAAKTKQAAATSSSSSDCIVVPNVVGKNHQAGQDRMQAAGLYMLDEEDASGQGRVLLFDRNWVDVAQDPAPGQCVSADTTVTLSAKKIGE
jgi:hypothetical protein